MDYDLHSNAPPDPDGGSNLIIATSFMLAFDAFFYLALMMYLEKVLPSEYDAIRIDDHCNNWISPARFPHAGTIIHTPRT